MGSHVQNQLQERCSKFVLLALDRSDNMKDSTQLLIFVYIVLLLVCHRTLQPYQPYKEQQLVEAF